MAPSEAHRSKIGHFDKFAANAYLRYCALFYYFFWRIMRPSTWNFSPWILRNNCRPGFPGCVADKPSRQFPPKKIGGFVLRSCARHLNLRILRERFAQLYSNCRRLPFSGLPQKGIKRSVGNFRDKKSRALDCVSHRRHFGGEPICQLGAV